MRHPITNPSPTSRVLRAPELGVILLASDCANLKRFRHPVWRKNPNRFDTNFIFDNMAVVSSVFASKKDKILKDLSIPPEDYTDLSPKGSIDVGIQELINEINHLEGLVTTSSCAGRISVFLEGSKEEVHKEDSKRLSSQLIVPGGKGNGGRWLFVSHAPVQQVVDGDWEEGPILKLFGMSDQIQSRERTMSRTTRFVKFQFEPMVINQLQRATAGSG